MCDALNVLGSRSVRGWCYIEEDNRWEGKWCEGMRWGRGVQFDRNGVVVYDGKWLMSAVSRQGVREVS